MLTSLLFLADWKLVMIFVQDMRTQRLLSLALSHIDKALITFKPNVYPVDHIRLQVMPRHTLGRASRETCNIPQLHSFFAIDMKH
eukprot:scaffold103150_cov19-Prasinocladus_malaysianus.AAC.1